MNANNEEKPIGSWFDKGEIEEAYRINRGGIFSQRILEDWITLHDELLKSNTEIGKLRAELINLREANRWIPVGERLPDDNVAVMICLENNCIDIMYHEADRWHMDYNGIAYADDCVTHWRPLPEPPAGPEVEA